LTVPLGPAVPVPTQVDASSSVRNQKRISEGVDLDLAECHHHYHPPPAHQAAQVSHCPPFATSFAADRQAAAAARKEVPLVCCRTSGDRCWRGNSHKERLVKLSEPTNYYTHLVSTPRNVIHSTPLHQWTVFFSSHRFDHLVTKDHTGTALSQAITSSSSSSNISACNGNTGKSSGSSNSGNSIGSAGQQTRCVSPTPTERQLLLAKKLSEGRITQVI
jgi:hypothetical protein